ncbi:MAG: DUF4381 domain-containing protein [Alphaproteobacteria bacterium]
MTPEEILKDLRDIHLPDAAAETAHAGFVSWPIALVLVMTLIALWFAWRRRSGWRRDITQHLDAIEQRAGEGRVREGWMDLATLLRRIAMGAAGRGAKADKGPVAGLIGDAWLEKLDQLFGTDAFSRGPGRGVIVFPYRADRGTDPSEQDDIADQLRATIAEVRQHLRNLRMA